MLSRPIKNARTNPFCRPGPRYRTDLDLDRGEGEGDGREHEESAICGHAVPGSDRPPGPLANSSLSVGTGWAPSSASFEPRQLLDNAPVNLALIAPRAGGNPARLLGRGAPRGQPRVEIVGVVPHPESLLNDPPTRVRFASSSSRCATSTGSDETAPISPRIGMGPCDHVGATRAVGPTAFDRDEIDGRLGDSSSETDEASSARRRISLTRLLRSALVSLGHLLQPP